MPEPRSSSNNLWDVTGVPNITFRPMGDLPSTAAILSDEGEQDVNPTTPTPDVDEVVIDDDYEEDDGEDDWAPMPVRAPGVDPAAVREAMERATWPTDVDVPATHVTPAHSMSSWDGDRVRITTHLNRSRIGTLMSPGRAYSTDWNSMGVLVALDTTRERGGMMPYLVNPDPGPARSYNITGRGIVVDVPAADVHPLRQVDPNVTVRVISHRNQYAIGRVMPAGVAFTSSSGARGVIIRVRRTTRGNSRRWLAPDPGEAGFGQYNVVTPPPVQVPRDHIIDIGDTPLSHQAFRVTGTSVAEDLLGTVRSCRDVYNLDCYATGVLLEPTAYCDAHTDPGPLLPAQQYAITDPPCISCGEQPDSCVCVRCHTCRVRLRRTTAINVNGNWYHDGCNVPCPGCHASRPRTDLHHVQNTHRTYCDNCTHTCQECDDPAIRLAGAARYCQDCGERVAGGTAGVRGYGHTHATRWLGGPLPKNDRGHQVGFYVGFELEITSGSRGTNSIKTWAHDNLGYRDALDTKSDSSVQGFEIASQPMTPEFFESVDWDSLMAVLNRDHPATLDYSASKEPVDHGLHVHIGRVAFERDDVATAMFTYLIGQDNGTHLERIGRRPASRWCEKVPKPASAGLVNLYNRGALNGKQAQRVRRTVSLGRDAINLSNQETIEIRAFRSTRDADHLRAAVRTVYLAAQYIAHLRGEKGQFGGGLVSPKSLHWDAFMKWVETVKPDAVDALRA